MEEKEEKKEVKDKKLKKVRKIKIIPILITIFIIGLLVLIFYSLTFLKITNIYVKGNTYIPDQEILELAKIDNYPSYIKTSTSSIKKKLQKNPYIKKVVVKKKLFRTIEITIEEEKILFRKDENNLVVLENGKEVDDKLKYNVPILLNYVPDTKYNTFLNKMTKINDSVKTEISEITYDPNTQDDDRFLLNMNDGNLVYLTLTKFKQINYYAEVLDQLEGKKGILYLDSGNHFKIMDKNEKETEEVKEEPKKENNNEIEE